MKVPPCLVDATNLPPPLLTSEPGSFAEYTVKVRIPSIVDEIIDLNDFPAGIGEALEALRREITDGPIRAMQEDTPDRRFWDALSHPYIGRRWLDVPWYWAEAFFYRRVLEATRYFHPGVSYHVDPFEAKKRGELEPDAGPEYVEKTLTHLPAERRPRFEVMLYASLWGNRMDLSHAVAMALGRSEQLESSQGNLLVDDGGRVWDYLSSRERGRVALVADNAGTELLVDLLLAGLFLDEGLASHVEMHLKGQPFFVSDAMPKDVMAAIGALETGGERARRAGRRIRQHLESERLHLRVHWLYTTSLFFFQLPPDLAQAFAQTDLVVVKGDANYRRLLGDAHWPPTTSFASVVEYFPAPVVTLRTLKSEIVVGLEPGLAERTHAQDAHWLVNGRRGVLQARLPQEH